MKTLNIILGVIIIAVLVWFVVVVHVWDKPGMNGILKITTWQKILSELGLLHID